MPLTDVYNYFRSYDTTTYEVCSQQGDEPTIRGVESFEMLLGFRLPDEFRDFAVHPLGGLYMAAREAYWPRPKLYQVGPWWSFAYGFLVYSLSPQAPEGMRIGEAWQTMAQDGYPQYAPFFKLIGDPETYCFTSEQKIVAWSYGAADNPHEIPASFSEFLISQIRDLEERVARKRRGEDKG
jgi:hypothetical protein